jgi:hypothetical protein
MSPFWAAPGVAFAIQAGRSGSARAVVGKSRHCLNTVYQQRATMSRDHMPSPPMALPADARRRRAPCLVSRRLVVIDSA